MTIDRAAESALESYSWPGNVRELSHVVERAQILCQTSCIKAHDLGLNGITSFDPGGATKNSDTDDDLRPMSEMEADIIDKRLNYFDGDASKAANSLGLSRSAFYRRLEKSKV